MLFSLYIYLFYRVDKTVINQIVISLNSLNSYASLKNSIVQSYPLPNLVVYSLPEALWVFFITLTSLQFYISIGKCKFQCKYLPVFFVVLLEFLQFFHFTNGSFDSRDIWLSFIFWCLAIKINPAKLKKQNLTRVVVFGEHLLLVFSYVIVYLAHVNS